MDPNSFKPLYAKNSALKKPSSNFSPYRPDNLHKSSIDLHASHEEASELIKEARKNAESIQKEAFELGFKQGEKAGLEQGQKEIRTFVEKIYEILQEVNETKKYLYTKNEKEIIDFILTVAHKIIKQELISNEEVILSTIKAAMRNMVDSSYIRMYLNPSDLKIVQDFRPHIFDSADGLKNIYLEEDQNIGQGGCIIETNFGRIDARIESQIEEIEETLKSEINSATS